MKLLSSNSLNLILNSHTRVRLRKPSHSSPHLNAAVELVKQFQTLHYFTNSSPHDLHYNTTQTTFNMKLSLFSTLPAIATFSQLATATPISSLAELVEGSKILPRQNRNLFDGCVPDCTWKILLVCNLGNGAPQIGHSTYQWQVDGCIRDARKFSSQCFGRRVAAIRVVPNHTNMSCNYRRMVQLSA